MNRRLFLTRALAAIPVVVAGEELLEMLAPRRTIFLPPRDRWSTRTPHEIVADIEKMFQDALRVAVYPVITFPALTSDWGKIYAYGIPT